MSTLILCKSGSELGLCNTRATLDCQSSYLYSTNSQQALPQDALYFKAPYNIKEKTPAIRILY